MKIATVTVTYNRKELLKQNIEAILNQSFEVDNIIIVDNHSTDNSEKEIKERFSNNEKITYIYLNENIGGAGGFYTGCKYAYENAYDWVILMDDDGKPKNEHTINNLLETINKMNKTEKDLVMMNSLVLCNENELSFSFFSMNDTADMIKEKANNNILEEYISPFNGTIISKALMEKIGYPNREFFIKGDEADYLLSAKNVGAYIGTVVDSLYYHPRVYENNLKKIKIINKEYYVFVEKPWKEYYRIRNYTYTYKKLKMKKSIIKLIGLKIIGIFVCKCNKIESLKMIIKGYRDGRKGKLGNTILPS